MLDRKTKDINASVELLQDRIKLYKLLSTLEGLFGIFMLGATIIPAYIITNFSFTGEGSLRVAVITICGFVFLSAGTIILLMFALSFENDVRHKEILLYLKLQQEKKKK